MYAFSLNHIIGRDVKLIKLSYVLLDVIVILFLHVFWKLNSVQLVIVQGYFVSQGYFTGIKSRILNIVTLLMQLTRNDGR